MPLSALRKMPSASGASGRSVTLTVLNAVQVQVSADLNGDGDTTDDADRTVTRNWSELY